MIGGIVALLIVGGLVAVGVTSCVMNAKGGEPHTATQPSTKPADDETARLKEIVRRLQAQVNKLSEENAALKRQLAAKAKPAEPPKEEPKINWNLDAGTITIDEAIKRLGKPVTRTSDGDRKTTLTWRWYADGNPDVVVRTLWVRFDARGKAEDYNDTSK